MNNSLNFTNLRQHNIGIFVFCANEGCAFFINFVCFFFQCAFFRVYMKVTSDKEPTEAVLCDMYVEANTYALASHFLWGMWAIVQYSTSDIPFDYLVSKDQANI